MRSQPQHQPISIHLPLMVFVEAAVDEQVAASQPNDAKIQSTSRWSTLGAAYAHTCAVSQCRLFLSVFTLQPGARDPTSAPLLDSCNEPSVVGLEP